MNDLNVKSSVVPQFGRDERDFVYAVARRFVSSPEAADDVAQDAMLLAYRYRNSFRGDSKFRSWLFRIASTTALGHLRRGRRSREHLAANDEATQGEVADAAPSPEALVGDHELAARAHGILARLAPKYRDVVMMRADHSELETAERLGITVANVKVRAHRARQQLREALENEVAASTHARRGYRATGSSASGAITRVSCASGSGVRIGLVR